MAKRHKRKVKKSVKFVLLLIVLLIGLFIINPLKSSVGNFKLKLSNINILDSTKKYKECLDDSKVFSEDDFSEALQKEKNNFKNTFDGNANFAYYDLTTEYETSKGGSQSLYAASVSKVPAVFYTYKLADEKKINLDKTLTYTSKYTHGGSGIIQKAKVGTKYKLSTLLEYAIKYSDNIAYFMILDQIGGKEKVKAYFKTLDIDITYSDNFGYLSPNLGVSYLKEVYKYYLSGSKNGKKLFDDMKVSDNMDYVKNKDVNYEIAHKYGWYQNWYNDISIVMSEHPYILSITSTKGFNEKSKQFFLKAHSAADKFNEAYYKEKGDYCFIKAYKK